VLSQRVSGRDGNPTATEYRKPSIR
jgi:hypothetical protein